MDKARIVRIYDDCGHEWGYFNLGTEQGAASCISVLTEALDRFEDNEAIDKLTELFKEYVFTDLTYDILTDALDDSLVYIEDIDIIG